MPYVSQETRDRIFSKDVNVPIEDIYSDGNEDGLTVIDEQAIDCAGSLNYAITVLIQRYLKRKGKNYQNMNDILGALDGAGKEFYRRVVSPYEDTKIDDPNNGDVMEC
jgi:hypothetical protein